MATGVIARSVVELGEYVGISTTPVAATVSLFHSSYVRTCPNPPLGHTALRTDQVILCAQPRTAHHNPRTSPPPVGTLLCILTYPFLCEFAPPHSSSLITHHTHTHTAHLLVHICDQIITRAQSPKHPTNTVSSSHHSHFLRRPLYRCA